MSVGTSLELQKSKRPDKDVGALETPYVVQQLTTHSANQFQISDVECTPLFVAVRLQPLSTLIYKKFGIRMLDTPLQTLL